VKDALMSSERIILISGSSFPGTAGDTANYLELMRGLRRKVTEILLVCPQHRQSKSFDVMMKEEGISVTRVPFEPPRLANLTRDRSLLYLLKLAIFYTALFCTVAEVLSRNRNKSIIIRHSLLTINLSPLLKIFRVRSLADGDPLSSSLVQTFDLLKLPKPALSLMKIYEKAILSCYTSYLASTETQKKLLIQLGIPESRIIVRTVAIDVRHVPSYDLEEIPPNTFGYFGALEKWQNVDLLLRTWAEVVKKKEEARLFIIGDGSLKNQLKRLAGDLNIEDSVTFYDGVSRDILWNKYFRLFRVVLVPRSPTYLAGNPSMKIFEALASGKPVIASSVKGVQDIAVEGMLLVSPENERAMSSAILRLCDDEHLLRQLSRLSVSSSKRLDISKQLDRLVNVLMGSRMQRSPLLER